ncbi:MAG TPA: adenylate/guanylate cyclase domain-containing protein [Oligoflexus sp.]|uniref:adenylate/guanylate cyclase domain-containing protein n=1 Tax=Oligoflexus sp. TaxID=1971216 RepID=UPI002D265693|nr:adenylate/guanylate cyclase domain-containing protein [Oligoflexus sp.]HYX31639.1 adenylate/guanylate cyclase domain-containing protein [Oligoflexus sp.]
MNWTQILFTFLLACCGAGPLFAYDLGQPETIEFAQYDAPHQLARWLQKELPQVDRDKRFKEWITGFVALLRSETNEAAIPKADELAFAEKTAYDRQFYREYLFVKRFRLMQGVQHNPENFTARKKIYIDMIEEARQLKQKGVELLILTELAWILIDTGNTKEGLGKLKDIPKIKPQDLNIGTYDWLEILHNCVAILPMNASQDQVLGMYRDIIKALEKTRPRYFLASAKSNTSLLLTRMGKSFPDLDPELLLLDAIAMSTEIDETMTMATSMSALGVYYHKKGRHQESLEWLQKALQLFQKLKSEVWLGDTYKKMARAHLGLQHYKDALTGLEQAQKIFKENYKQDQLEILDLQQQALAALNQPKEAYAKLEQHLKLYHETLAANESSEVNARLIDNQIDLEQARGLALEVEAAAKRRKTLVEEQLQQITTGRKKSLDILIRGALLLLILIIVLTLVGRKLHQKTHDVHLHIRENLLQRFVPPALAHAIAAGEKHVEQDPKRYDITVVFARIPHFEDLIQKLGPNHLAEALNLFLEAMSEVIFAHGGTIDKFNRGTLMILFGAPLPMDDESQVRSATRCAEAMIMRLDQLQKTWSLPHGLYLQLAIGIHHGPALVGFFGGEQRTDYTAIGATVNMASRIEGLAAPGDIVVSELIALILKDDEYRLMGHFILKGIELHQALYIWVRHGEQEAVS